MMSKHATARHLRSWRNVCLSATTMFAMALPAATTTFGESIEAVVRDADTTTLLQLAAAQGDTLSTAERVILREVLLERLATDDAALSAMDANAFADVGITLKTLGAREQQTGPIVARWIASGSQWQSATPAELARIVRSLKFAGPQRSSIRPQVVEYAANTLLSGDWAGDGRGQLLTLARPLAGMLDADQQQALAATIQAAAGDNALVLAELTFADVQELCGVLQLLSVNVNDQADDPAAELRRLWVEQTTQWKSADRQQTTQLLTTLTADDSHAAAAQVAAYAYDQYLAAAPMNLADVTALLGAAAPHLDATAKQSIAARITQQFTASDAALAALAPQDVQAVRAALAAVDVAPQEIDAATARWADLVQPGRSLDPQQLLPVMKLLTADDAAALQTAAQNTLTEAAARYFADNQPTAWPGAADAAHWLDEVRHHTPASTKPTLLGTLRKVFAADGAALASLDPKPLQRLQHAALGLGASPAEASDLYQAWFTANDRWRQYSARQLAQAYQLSYQEPVGADQFAIRWTGSITPPQSGEYSFHVAADCGVRLWIDDQLIIDDWHDTMVAWPDLEFSQRVGGALRLQAGQPYAIRLEYCEQWTDACVTLAWSNQTMPKQIVAAEYLVPTSGAGLGLSGEYVATRDLARQPVATRIDRTIDFHWGDKPPLDVNAAIRATLAAYFYKQYLSDDAFIATATADDLRNWITMFGDALPDAQRAELLTKVTRDPGRLAGQKVHELRAMRRAFAGLPAGQAADLIIAWAQVNPTGVALVAAGDIPYYWFHHTRYWQLWAADPEPQQIPRLTAALIDGSGLPNLTLARLLAVAHADVGSLDPWRDQLDARLVDTTVQGDAKALWLLARAYVDEAQSFDHSPLATQPYLERAVACAQSDAVRRNVFRHYGLLFEHHCDRGDVKQAMSLLDQMDQLFPDPASAELLDFWRYTTLARDTVAIAARHPQIADSLRRDLERQLATAQADDQTAQVDHYQELLERVTMSQPQ